MQGFRPTSSVPRNGKKYWPSATAPCSVVCRRARSSRHWPMRDATWPRSPASTTYCGRRINSTTEAVARNRSARPRVSTVPSAPIRSGWDITWLPGPARGLFYYLYLVMDLYSRKIVGWEIHECEASDLTAWLVRRACLVESIASQPLVLHSNNGSPMKGASMLETLHQLGVASSFSPRVSNDNAYAERCSKPASPVCQPSPIQSVNGIT